MVKRFRRVTAALVIFLSTLLLPVLTNYLSEIKVPAVLHSPWVVVPLALAIFGVVAADQLTGRDGGSPRGGSRLFTTRLIKTTVKTLEGLDRGSIDVEARARLGDSARMPLRLRPPPDDGGPVGGITGPDDLLRSVVALRGGLKLALVGEPGSGKTTFLRDLARELAADADQRGPAEDYVVPVLVDAAAWPEGVPFDEHLHDVVQLRSSVPRRAFVEWLEDGALYLLIDNVSWLPAPRRRRVIEELNAFRASHPTIGMLVAVNEEMARAQGALLDLPRVTVEPLSPAEVIDRLASLRDTHATLYQVALASPALVETMRTRLFLTAALLAFQDGGVDVAERLRTPDAPGAIVSAYVEWLLSHRDRAGVAAETTAEGRAARQRFLTNLSWVATQLKRMEASYFRDYFTVPWIPQRRRRRIVNLLVGALAGVVTGLTTAIIVVPRHERTGWWVSAGIVALFLLVRIPERTAAEFLPARTARPRTRWSAREFRQAWRGPYGLMTVAGIAYGGYVLYGQATHWSTMGHEQRRHALVFALVTVLANSALIYLQGLRMDMADTENWAVGPLPRPVFRFLLRSARWAFYAALAVGSGCFLVRAAFRLLAHSLFGGGYPSFTAAVGSLGADLSPSLLVAEVVLGAVFVWLMGLLIEVAVVEAVLSDEAAAPENLRDLLDRAVRLSFVQRRGGNEYVFSHQLLRDHLAG